MEMKTCTQCKQEYPKTTEYFYKKRKSVAAICKSCRKIYDAEYRNNNKEEIKQRQKNWFQKNKSYKNEQNRQHWLKNRESYRIRERRYRARKLQNVSEPYTEQQVLDKYGHNCYLCQEPIDFTVPRKEPKGFQVEHVIAISKGGPDTLENVRPSHAACNWSKGNKIIQSQVL